MTERARIAARELERRGWQIESALVKSPTNREALERECGDVYHAIWRLIGAKDIDGNGMSQRADDKAKSVAQYLHHAG